MGGSMGYSESEFVSPLKKAKGLGSAHDGTHHWIMQKVTAIALVPLVLWLVFSFIALQGASYAQFTGWLAQPVSTNAATAPHSENIFFIAYS